MAYVGLALWVTGSWWTPLGGRLTALNQPDAVLFSWLFTWTPHALGGQQVPLYAAALNAPFGVNLMWNNGMALPALLFAPVTAARGGLATVTVVIAVGLASSATAAFAALRALGAATLPAALGGGVFGFSPAIVAQALGHPDLVLDVLAPVLVLLGVRLAVADAPQWRTAVLLGLTAAAQLLIGEEVLFDAGLVVALILVALTVSHPRSARQRLPRFLAQAGVALGVFAVLGGPLLAFQLVGPLQQTGSPFAVSYFGIDLANYVVPTPRQLFTPGVAAAESAVFPGGPEERGGYLGWPLLVVAAAALVLLGRRERVRIPLLLAFVVAMLAMGERLRIGGRTTVIALPWNWLAALPGFEHAIPNRLALFTAGLVGAGLAFALTSLRDAGRSTRIVATTIVVLALIPLLPAPLPGVDAPAVPAFFTSAAAQLCPGGSVLVLPFPAPDATDPLLWQEASGMAFAMPGGYFIGPAADGHAYIGGPPSRSGVLLRAVAADGRVRPVTPDIRAAFSSDVAQWRACAAVLGPSPHFDALRAQTEALTGTIPESVGGVLLWRLHV
ncbi:MAG TPA: hypothetical protein VGE11_26300 [Pseudonocardia sp.]